MHFHVTLLNTAKLTAVAVLLLAALSGCDVQSDSTEERHESLPTLTVGVDTFPPFNYTDTDGNPTGVDIDLAKEAFGRMGFTPVFETIDWEKKKQLVEDGSIDCIWSCFSMNGREDEYRWAGPYMYSRQVIAVNKSSDIYSLRDLDGRTVALQSTTKPEELFRTHNDDRLPRFARIISVPHRELIYTFLSKGYVDALAAHDTAIEQFMKDYELDGFRILDEELLKADLGVAFAVDDKRGIDVRLADTLKEMLEDGTTRQIILKYMSDPDRYLEDGNES